MKRAVISAVVATALVTGFFFAWRIKDRPPSLSGQEPKPPLSSNTNASAGAYLTHSDDIVAKTSGTKILFFHAPWCPQCRDLEQDIKAKRVPEGVTIIKVDYDSNQTLRQKYGVTIQTTLVRVDDNGNLIKKFVAYDDPTLDAVKLNLL